jgi:uncharacterized membrane protein YecN with MAPEG domain
VTDETASIERLKRVGLVVSFAAGAALLGALAWLLATRRPDASLIAPWRWTALATLGAMIVYQYVSLQVNRARHEYQVRLPEVTGPDGFNRVFRVHMNTLESLPLFLPLLWLSAATWGDVWAGALGAAWVVGRFLFAWGYYRAVSLRVCGFGISNTVCVVMLVSCAYGVIAGSW